MVVRHRYGHRVIGVGHVISFHLAGPAVDLDASVFSILYFDVIKDLLRDGLGDRFGVQHIIIAISRVIDILFVCGRKLTHDDGGKRLYDLVLCQGVAGHIDTVTVAAGICSHRAKDHDRSVAAAIAAAAAAVS